MKKGLLIMIILSLSLGIWLGTDQSRASALSCAGPRPVSEELKVSATVFRGTLISYNPKADVSQTNYVFEVAEWWKGDMKSSTITLYTNGWESFEEGKEYVVFANKGKEKFKPRLCGNTGLSSSVDTTSLGEGIQPEKPNQPAKRPRNFNILDGLIELIRYLQNKY
ncbi:hypothetical protein [Paenibacillus solani]|uniref:hypothetical protein n=1 Tax=Paenibacillus solani TaxID=1705565 RepID=UPI003D2CE30E